MLHTGDNAGLYAAVAVGAVLGLVGCVAVTFLAKEHCGRLGSNASPVARKEPRQSSGGDQGSNAFEISQVALGGDITDEPFAL